VFAAVVRIPEFIGPRTRVISAGTFPGDFEDTLKNRAVRR
jgi:hypothetical protein